MTRWPTAYLTRRESFCASHRLHSPGLSPEDNQALFGKCNHVHGHGHNYELEVTVRGPIDPVTGLVMNLSDLKAIVHSHILNKVDHRHLNLDIPEFADLNPTAENIAFVFWRWLEPALPNLHSVKIFETNKNIAIVTADDARGSDLG